MGGKTLDQFNSRQQARAKKVPTEKEVNTKEPDELGLTQSKQSRQKEKY